MTFKVRGKGHNVKSLKSIETVAEYGHIIDFDMGTHLCVHISGVYTHTHTHTHTRARARTRAHARARTHARTRMHARTHTHTMHFVVKVNTRHSSKGKNQVWG